MVSFWELLLLGAIAGFTIFLGLPVMLAGTSERLRGFLNAIAVGILVFLIIDVFGHAWQVTSDSVVSAYAGLAPTSDATVNVVLMFGGLGLGLLGLVSYEERYVGRGKEVSPRKLAVMIAAGIGAHNLSEGLAIGQSYAYGSVGLALVLVVGFAAHNATEGFGITAPLLRAADRPNLGFLVKILLLGGAPTFFGTLAGSLAYSQEAYLFFLSLAGGALVYVTMLMFNTGRRQYSNGLMMWGIFFGLCAGFLTDLIVAAGGG